MLTCTCTCTHIHTCTMYMYQSCISSIVPLLVIINIILYRCGVFSVTYHFVQHYTHTIAYMENFVNNLGFLGWMLIHGIAVHKLLYNYVHMYVCIYNFILYVCMCVVIVPNLVLCMYMYAYIYIYIYIYKVIVVLHMYMYIYILFTIIYYLLIDHHTTG